MKVKLFYIIILPILFIQCKKKYLEGPSDDKGRYECEWNDKGRNGICNFYDSINNFKGFINYKDDTADGEFKSYYKDGKLKEEGLYHKNKIINSFDYDKNGVVNFQCLSENKWIVFKYYKNIKIFKKRYTYWDQLANDMKTDSSIYYNEVGKIIYKFNHIESKMYKCENDDCFEIPIIGNNEREFVKIILGKETEEVFYVPSPFPDAPWFY